MSGCTCENWSLQDLSSALQDMHKDNKKIVVPMFQRGKRWNKNQENVFIDSLIKGYPVGTMLFYETVEGNKITYILVDGLQRGNSIKKYMTNPTDFFYDNNISDEFCAEILRIIGHENEEYYQTIRTILTSFIREQKMYKNLQYYSVSKKIVDEFEVDNDLIQQLIDTIELFFEERQELYDRIANTVIPVIVYTGEESNLPDIFDRINSKGTPLDQYEVYAAAWPVNEKYEINNLNVIEHIVKKYDSFVEDGYFIHDYSRDEIRSTRKVNAFEYLFGLGKYFVDKYDILAFKKNLADDTVNPIAFELINACLNDSDKIRILYKNLQEVNLNELEQAICKSIDFVDNAISVITKFKGNSRNKNKIFHSKYQILSMISTTFKEMFSNKIYTEFSDEWQSKKSIIAKNLVNYYVYDIITNYWSEGGTGKIHSAAKPNRYMNDITSKAWIIALDDFFERSMLRTESKKVANPKSEEFVILNCIYLNNFTAMDQLSIDRFDVEHIAPTEQMRRLVKTCQGEGLPISCIANLCYLPEYINRSKKDRNFYQDPKYLQNVKLDDIETKYSFTEKDDLDWMDMPYEKPDDFTTLKENYTNYCVKRFDKIKKLFCDALGIRYEGLEGLHEELVIAQSCDTKQLDSSNVKITDKSVLRLTKKVGCELIRVGKKTYMTPDGKKGFLFTTSKTYIEGDRERFWYSHTQKSIKDIIKCEEYFIAYVCGDESTIVMLPLPIIEESLDAINTSRDDDGKIKHWHIVFFKNADNHMTWLLSKPESREINIDQYIL